MAACPLLLGHRGARGEKSIPENTPAAFDLALAHGCDGFEFDVRLTADGHAVICHDETSGRVRIARRSAGQLHLPRLEEILSRYKDSAFLDIELKVPGLEKITANLIAEFAPARGFVVSSFLPEVLSALHNVSDNIPLGLICETSAQLSRWPDLPVEYVIPHHRLLQPRQQAALRAADKKVFVWTVNPQADMLRFTEWGVDGIISDHPQRLASTLRARSLP